MTVPACGAGPTWRLPAVFADEHCRDLFRIREAALAVLNGAAGLALLALAATKADAWATVNAGQISRSKADPRAAMQALAEQYIGMSDEVMLDASKDVAFGVARVDWMPEVSADAEKLRDLAEDLEG